MFTSTAQQEFKEAVKAFTAVKEAEWSYAYTTGYLESLAVSMFASLPKKQQKFYLEQMQGAVDKQAV